MTSHKAIDKALDALDGSEGQVEAEVPGGQATVDVVAVDGLGVKVRGVKVHRSKPFELETECRELPDRVRSLPHRLQPVEVDPLLGGGVLRSRPEEMRKKEFYQVDLVGDRDVGVRRYRVGKDGQRSPIDFTMTREQLGDLIDEIS